MEVKVNGATRLVILIRRYAFKIPSLHSWKNFLWGLLANIQEREFSRVKDMQHKLCPVLFSLPGGFLVVMPKVQVLRDDEMSREELEEFCVCDENYTIPAEIKPDSFGWYKGILVAIDYG